MREGRHGCAMATVWHGGAHGTKAMHGRAAAPGSCPFHRCPPTALLAPAQATLVYCRRLGVTARLRALLWVAAALYTFGLYSEVRLSWWCDAWGRHGCCFTHVWRTQQAAWACAAHAAWTGHRMPRCCTAVLAAPWRVMPCCSLSMPWGKNGAGPRQAAGQGIYSGTASPSLAPSPAGPVLRTWAGHEPF